MSNDGQTTPAAHPRRPRPLWRRLLKWLLLGLLVLVVALAVFIGWVVGTRSGLEFAWSLVEPRLPDTIEVAKVEGRLIGPLTVSGIKINNASMHAEVERVHLEWQAADLLSATVHIEKLAVRGVRYRDKTTAPEPPPEKESEPFTLSEFTDLLVRVRIDRLAVNNVSITPSPGAEPIVLTRARLKDARLTDEIWRIGSLTAHGPRFDLKAHAEMVPHGDYATQLVLNAALRLPDLAPIKTELRINGDLDKLTLTQHVAAPYNVTLNATVTDIAFDALAGIGIDATLQLQDTHLSAIRAELPDVAPITTELHIAGTPQKLTLHQTVASPYNVRLAATLSDLLATPVIDAQLTLDGTKLAAIMKDLPKVTLNTELNVSGTPERLKVALDAEADSAQYGRLTATARVRYTPEAVTIEHLRLQRPGTPMRLKASGTVALSKGNEMDLTLQWQQLRWPLTGDQPGYRSRKGHFQLTGTLKDYHIDGWMSWQITGQAEGQLQLSGSGDRQSFHLAQLKISGAPGDITATAEVTWVPALDVHAHIEGSHINPGAVVPNVPGDFSLVADIRASQQGKTIIAHVDTLTAEGSLRGQPLQLDAELAYLGNYVKIPQFELEYAAASVNVSGQLGWTPASVLDLRWAIEAEDLSTLWPTLAGALQTRGTVQGTVAAPAVDATLTARNIEYGDYSVASVDLDAHADWSGATQSRVTLEVVDAQLAGQAVHSLALELTGTPASHTLELGLDSSTAQLALALEGGLDKQRMVWNFTLTSLRATYGKLAPWTLAAPASGQVSASAQRIANACLTSGAARLCISGEHTAEGTSATLELDDLAFAYAEPFLPDNLGIAGALSGTVKARLPAGGTPVVDMHLETTPGRITTVKRNGERVQVLAFDPARVDVTLNDTGLNAVLALPLADTGAIHAEFSVAPDDAPLTERPLNGQIEINIARLNFLTRLSSEVAALEGHIEGNVRISGTLVAPRVLGEIALEARRIVLLTPGLELTDVRLAAAGHGEAIDISMVAHSGGGKLTVDGAIGLGGIEPTIDLAIKGQAFQVANTPIVRAWISPDLEVSVTSEAVHVTGRLEVPKARITPRELPAAGVETVAEDAVIVTEEDGAVEAAARAIYADITVVLGDIRFKGFGLKTGITGKLHVTQAPGRRVTGAGKLTLVDGSYRAYGQNLDILQGHIYFAGGAISNPAIELRAARYPAEDITVGVEVRGSVEQPRITLFSDPRMSQAEILSWLLLGRPLEGTTGGQDNLIAKAALALGSGRANKMLNNIGDALGLDDIGLGSAAGYGSSEAAFMVGKYLTPRLYISYGIGIFSGIGTLSLRYTLNSHWELQTSTSDIATGVDLIYTFGR